MPNASSTNEKSVILGVSAHPNASGAYQTSPDEVDPKSALDRALLLASTANRASLPTLQKTRHRTITRRAVMWLGQTCNLRCYFCYFLDRIATRSHPEHDFMELEKSKEICDTLVRVYGNNAIDIQGGEPTIWRHILELISHCHKIGLEPTLITNALVLDNPETCKKYKEAGVRDFLISVHGIGDVHDRVVVSEGAHVRQMNALRNLQEIGIPFRFNCVLSKPVVPQLPYVAELAVRTGARAVNFLAFNPFEDQGNGGRRSALNVAKYTEIKPFLTQALDTLDAGGVEANVRYFPICMAEERHRKSMYNFQQLSYDHHEWDYASWTWTGKQQQRMKEGPPSNPMPMTNQRLLWKFKKPLERIMAIKWLAPILSKFYSMAGRSLDVLRSKESLYRENARVRAELHAKYVYAKACEECSLRHICDGFHGDYAEIFGTEEAETVRLGETVEDPKYYISRQEKLVEPEDLAWALPSEK